MVILGQRKSKVNFFKIVGGEKVMIDKNFATYGDFKFDYEWDKGGDPNYPNLKWIKNKGEFIGKRYFKIGTHKRHIRNFMKKIANDKEYRKKWDFNQINLNTNLFTNKIKKGEM